MVKEGMIRKKFYIPKNEIKRNYHDYTGVPKTYEIIHGWEYEKETDMEVNEWYIRFH